MPRKVTKPEAFVVSDMTFEMGRGGYVTVPTIEKKDFENGKEITVHVPTFAGKPSCLRCDGRVKDGDGCQVEGGWLIEWRFKLGGWYHFAAPCPECVFGAYRRRCTGRRWYDQTEDLTLTQTAMLQGNLETPGPGKPEGFCVSQAVGFLPQLEPGTLPCRPGDAVRAAALVAMKSSFESPKRPKRDFMRDRYDLLLARGVGPEGLVKDLEAVWGVPGAIYARERNAAAAERPSLLPADMDGLDF